jgi:diguanylate cyclase (GGDEF)-like protein
MQELVREGTAECRERCETVSELVGAVKDLRVRNALLEQQANHDDLTVSLRRNQFFELSQRQFSLAHRHQRPLSVLLLDADNFKAINDTYGHAIGDEVLQAIADTCRHNLRSSDIFGRYGGEEFAITLPETALAEAAVVAERIRSSIAEYTLHHSEHGPIRCTVSIGVATLDLVIRQGFDQLLQQADEMLLRAKGQGRNFVAIS